jgi:hypothetical protein
MEPTQPTPPPPAALPFDPTPRPARSGCPKPVVIGCLGLLVLAGLGLVALLFYASSHIGQLLQLSLNQSEAAVFSQMPRDVPQEDQQRLRDAFEKARQRATNASTQELAEASQQLQLKTLEIVRKGKSMSRQDVQELTKALEEFAGGKSP